MQRIKAFVKRHRVLFGVWIGLEILSIPAAALLLAPEGDPMVTVVNIPVSETGLQSFLVAADTPFVVEVGGVTGEVRVNVASGGYVGTMRYGEKAQMPGVARTCAVGRIGTVEAYRAKLGTFASRGNVEAQAVRVDVRTEALATVRIVAAEESVSLPGEACA